MPRTSTNQIVDSLVGSITEGIFDPYIFKAIFMAGGGGSGKSYHANNMFGTKNSVMGFRVVNSDDILEWRARGAGLDLSDLKVMQSLAVQAELATHGYSGHREMAKELIQKRSNRWIDGRLPLIIDGTGGKAEKIFKMSEYLKSIGYDVAMVLVNTPLEVAQANNKRRARQVDPAVIADDWQAVQAAKPKFAQYFRPWFYEIAMGYTDKDEVTREVVPKLTRLAARFAEKPVQNPVGRAWIRLQTAKMNPEFKLGVGTGRVGDYGSDEVGSGPSVGQRWSGFNQRESFASQVVNNLLQEQDTSRLEPSLRQKINRRIAFPNTYFPSLGVANGKIADVLNDFGLELDDLFSGFHGPSGRRTFFLKYADVGDVPGAQISNSQLYYSWYRMPSGNFEVTTYLS